MNIENSLRALISPSKAPNRPASGPDIPAANRGFCRSNAANRVDPERGSPEMKWMAAIPRLPEPTRPRCRFAGGNRAPLDVGNSSWIADETDQIVVSRPSSTRACLVMALNFPGDADGAKLASEGLLAAAEANSNPTTACFAFFGHRIAYRAIDPVVCHDSLCRALAIAQDCGNRQLEAANAVMLSLTTSDHTNPSDSLDYLSTVIRHYLDAGSVSLMHNPLAILAGVLARLGHYEQAATLTGVAASPMALAG